MGTRVGGKVFFGQKCGLVGQCGTVLEKCGRSTPSGKREGKSEGSVALLPSNFAEMSK